MAFKDVIHNIYNTIKDFTTKSVAGIKSKIKEEVAQGKEIYNSMDKDKMGANIKMLHAADGEQTILDTVASQVNAWYEENKVTNAVTFYKNNPSQFRDVTGYMGGTDLSDEQLDQGADTFIKERTNYKGETKYTLNFMGKMNRLLYSDDIVQTTKEASNFYNVLHNYGLDQGFEALTQLEDQYNNHEIGYIEYSANAKKIGKNLVEAYNQGADSFGFPHVDNVNTLADNYNFLHDAYESISKENISAERKEIKTGQDRSDYREGAKDSENEFRANSAKMTEEIIDKVGSWFKSEGVGVEQQENIKNNTDAQTNKIADELFNYTMELVNAQDANEVANRTWDGGKLSVVVLQQNALETINKMVYDDIMPMIEQYNKLIEIGADEESLKTAEKLIQSNLKTYKNIMEAWVESIGTKDVQSIEQFYNYYEKKYGETIQAGLGKTNLLGKIDKINVLDPDRNEYDGSSSTTSNYRQLMNLANRELMQYNFKQMFEGDGFWDKASSGGHSAVNMLSWMWGNVVTPAVKDLRNRVFNRYSADKRYSHDVIERGYVDALLASDDNMLKSTLFNLNPQKQNYYTFTDTLRTCVTYSSDVGEFLLPIAGEARLEAKLFGGVGRIGKVSKLNNAEKLANAAERLAKIAKTSGLNKMEILDKTTEIGKLLDSMKPGAVKYIASAGLKTAYDMTVVNAVFETRMPDEYTQGDFILDIFFNGMEDLIRAKRAMGAVGRLSNWELIKRSNTFKDSVVKEYLADAVGPDLAAKQFEEIAANANELNQARIWAANYIDQVESSRTFLEVYGFDAGKVSETINIRKSIFNDYRQKLIEQGQVTESEIIQIVDKNITDNADLATRFNEAKKEIAADFYKKKKASINANKPATHDNELLAGLLSKDTKKQENAITSLTEEMTENSKAMADPTTLNKFELANRQTALNDILEQAYVYRALEGKMTKTLKDASENVLDDNLKFVNKQSSDGNFGSVYDLDREGTAGTKSNYHKLEDASEKWFVNPKTGKVSKQNISVWEWTPDDNTSVVFHVFEKANGRSEVADFKKFGYDDAKAYIFDNEADSTRLSNKIKGFDDEGYIIVADRRIAATDEALAKWLDTDDAIRVRELFSDLSNYRVKADGITRVFAFLPSSKAGREEGWFEFKDGTKGTLKSIRDLDVDVTNLILRFGGRNPFTVYETYKATAKNKKLQKMLTEAAGFTTDQMREVESFYKNHNIERLSPDNNFSNYFGDINGHDVSTYNRATKNTDITTLRETYHPKTLVEDSDLSYPYQEKLNEARVRDGVNRGEPELVKIGRENLDTIRTIRYDYDGLMQMDLKGSARAKRSITNFFDKVSNAFMGKNSAWLPRQFREGYNEFIRIAKAPQHMIDGYKISEYMEMMGFPTTDAGITDMVHKFKTITEKLEQGIELTAEEVQINKLISTIEIFYEDMSDVTARWLAGYNPKNLGLADKIKAVRGVSESESMFHHVYYSDKELWNVMTNSDKDYRAKYIETFGLPPTVFGSDDAKMTKINEIITDLGRQGKGAFLARLFTGMGMDASRARRLNNFLTGGAYIVGTTIFNPTLIMAQLFMNGSGLAVDYFYKKELGIGTRGSFSRKELHNIMQQYGILYDPDSFSNIISRSTTVGGLINELSHAGAKKISNMINAGVYNAIEMSMETHFRMEQLAQVLYQDYGIKNMGDFDNYLKSHKGSEQDFFRELNNRASERYIKRTGNQLTEMDKFAFGSSANILTRFHRDFMWSISLLSNWGTTHMRSAADTLLGYSRAKMALNYFESGKGSMSDAVDAVKKFMNYDSDLQMYLDKLFIAFTIGRKADMVSRNDIEPEQFGLKMSDIWSFVQLVYAPAASYQSNPIMRILINTIAASGLTNSETREEYEKLGIDQGTAAATAFVNRVFAEMRRRYPIAEALAGAFGKGIEDGDDSDTFFTKFWKNYKEVTSGFGYFIDEDVNYYGYHPDMPYTPQSELTLLLGTDWNKYKEEYSHLNTLKQLAKLQENMNSSDSKWPAIMDYYQYRLPFYREYVFSNMGTDNDYDTKQNAYVVNTPERWNYLRNGELRLNDDKVYGEYVYNLVTADNVQQFSDSAKAKKFLENMQKQYGWIDDTTGELVLDIGLNNKEEEALKIMIKSMNEGNYEQFLKYFNAEDSNNKQKQGLLLMAYIQAIMDANGKGDEAPMLTKTLIASLAQQEYYDGASFIRKNLGYDYEYGKGLSDYSNVAANYDAQLKYGIANKYGRTLYITDKTAWASLGRYVARDRAIAEGDKEALSLFSDKFQNGKLKYGQVTTTNPERKDNGKKSTSTLQNNLNTLYLLTDLMLASGDVTNADKFNVGLASLVVPSSQKDKEDPERIQILLGMSKLIAEKIDDSVIPQQEKTANKLGIAAALLPIINYVDDELIQKIGEDRYRSFLNWIYGTMQDWGADELELAYRLAQQGEREGVSAETGTVMDGYDKYGNYGNTHWSKDYEGTASKARNYASKLGPYYNTKYNYNTTTGKYNSNNYGAITSAYKNLSLSLTNAKSQRIPGSTGSGTKVATGFTTKGKKPGSIKGGSRTKTKLSPAGQDEGYISSGKTGGGLVRGTNVRRNPTGRFPAIIETYREG